MSERLRQLRREPRDELEGAEREVLKMARREDRRRRLDRVGWILAIALWGLSFWADHQQDERITTFIVGQTEQRADATLQSCRERNADRAVQRAQITTSIAQTRNAPEEAFELFGLTKEASLARLRERLEMVRPLDPTCKERVRSVRRELEELE